MSLPLGTLLVVFYLATPAYPQNAPVLHSIYTSAGLLHWQLHHKNGQRRHPCLKHTVLIMQYMLTLTMQGLFLGKPEGWSTAHVPQHPP